MSDTAADSHLARRRVMNTPNRALRFREELAQKNRAPMMSDLKPKERLMRDNAEALFVALTGAGFDWTGHRIRVSRRPSTHRS